MDKTGQWERVKELFDAALERDPADPQYLVTVRGVGFRFDAEGRGDPERC